MRQFAKEEQDPAIVEDVNRWTSLAAGEGITYIGVQKKPVVTVAPECVILTTQRVIVYRPKLPGGVNLVESLWRNVAHAKLTEAMSGSTLAFVFMTGKLWRVEYLPKAQGRRLYALAQEMLEEAREERRPRALEENRAAAGAVIVA